MAQIKNITIAGPSGPVAQALIPLLLNANYTITALTRSTSSTPTNLPPTIKVLPVDYNSLPALTAALKDQDAVVSTVGSAGIASQHLLIDAAIAAGVKRFIPSEFGCDSENARARGLPVYAQKVEVAEALERKCEGTGMTYTFVYNNAFLDWGITHKFLIDLEGKKFDIYDGGESFFTATPLSFVAEGVVAVLGKLEETANRGVRLHGARLTQNQFLGIAKRVVGDERWTITEKESEVVEKEAWGALEKEPANVMGWAIGFLMRAIYGEGFGGDFEGQNDNEVLGLRVLGEREVEEVVRGCV